MKRRKDIEEFGRLEALIRKERKALLTQWRHQVSQLPAAHHLDKSATDDRFRMLIDEFAAALQSRSNETISEAQSVPDLFLDGVRDAEDGIDIEKLIAEYHILSGCIHDVADANGLNLRGTAFHILNRLFSRAIGLAVKQYVAERELEVQQHRGEYLAFVAHDLKTPLTAISLATRVLELKLDKPSASAAQMLNTLHRNVHFLDGLVDKVLEENTNRLTELGVRLERREFALWPLVATLIYDLHAVAETGGIELVNRVPEGLVVCADAGLLRRVFQNLIAYAMKYTPRGAVTIGARKLDADHSVECWVGGDSVRIPEKLLATVFDESETESHKNRPLRVGMGLSIARTFVEAHDGKVTAESKEGFGSTFRFTLPVRLDKAVAS